MRQGLLQHARKIAPHLSDGSVVLFDASNANHAKTRYDMTVLNR